MLGELLIGIGVLCGLAAVVRMVTVYDLFTDGVFKASTLAASFAIGSGFSLLVPTSTFGAGGQLATGVYVLGLMGVTLVSFWSLGFVFHDGMNLRRIVFGPEEPVASAETDEEGHIRYERDIEHETTGATVRQRKVQRQTTTSNESTSSSVEESSEEVNEEREPFETDVGEEEESDEEVVEEVEDVEDTDTFFDN